MEQAVISSPLGPLTLFAEDGHLTALVYGDYGGYDDLPLFREAKRQLEEYFAGQRHTFSLPMAPDGGVFCGKGGRKGESFLHFEWQIFYCGLVWLGFCHFLQNPSPFGETVKKNCKNIFYLI